MNNWTNWIDIESAKSQRGLLNNYGIYQIRVVDLSGQPIPIHRLVGVDALGLLYIGRSGYRRQQTNRTIANRIKEFLQQAHSGGITYARAKQTLERFPSLVDHKLQVRGMFLSDHEIDVAESTILKGYFAKYAELPPCNSSLPKAIKTSKDSKA